MKPKPLFGLLKTISIHSLKGHVNRGFSLVGITLFFLVSLFRSSYSFSQQINFKNFNTISGLSSDEVYEMYQDGNGLMWFATDRGLCSFNGQTFKQYGKSSIVGNNL